MASKKVATVATNRCVSCGSCVPSCPVSAITILNGCYATVDKDKCVGCGKCANICPAGIIEIHARTM